MSILGSPSVFYLLESVYNSCCLARERSSIIWLLKDQGIRMRTYIVFVLNLSHIPFVTQLIQSNQMKKISIVPTCDVWKHQDYFNHHRQMIGSFSGLFADVGLQDASRSCTCEPLDSVCEVDTGRFQNSIRRSQSSIFLVSLLKSILHRFICLSILYIRSVEKLIELFHLS